MWDKNNCLTIVDESKCSFAGQERSIKNNFYQFFFTFKFQNQ